MQEVYIRKTIYEFFTKMTENIKEPRWPYDPWELSRKEKLWKFLKE